MFRPNRPLVSPSPVASPTPANDALKGHYESVRRNDYFVFGVIATLGAMIYFFGQPDPMSAPF